MNSVEPSEPSPSGRLVANKYRLERLLGEGGMACIWLARNVQLDMPVALKLLRPELVSPELSARLRAEARASAHFSHPAIIRIYDIEETPSGEPCIVRELLEGENLYQRTQRAPMGAIELVQLLLPIADALCFVHDRGFIHRDLKPENIFLASGPGRARVQPKLLDFGIAKSVGPAPRQARSYSGTGTIVGSPGYVSPEQACGAELDERTDVWSFCVVLYEALAQRPAFAGDTPAEVLQSVLRDQPAPLDEHEVDPALARIVLGGLTKDRASRTPSLQRLGAELAEWLAARGIHDDVTGNSIDAAWLKGATPPLDAALPAPPVRPRRPRTLLATAGLLGLALVATGTWAILSKSPPPPPARVTPVTVSEPIVLAPPPDLNAPPIRLEAAAPAPPVTAKRAVNGPPPAGFRPSSKGRPSADPAGEKDVVWGPTNPYGI